MILYIENPKDSIGKLLELISEFSKVVGYKINIQKSLAFPYTIMKKSKREIKELIPLTIATKRIKYLGIKLPKETKELYTENIRHFRCDLNQIPYDYTVEVRNRFKGLDLIDRVLWTKSAMDGGS